MKGSGSGAIRVTGQGPNGRVEWRTAVSFPDRSNANAFVPRLWATQRIGWLSAERRRDGGSVELDDELRTLGLRYGIPTELTSYMVREPRAMASNQSGGSGAGGGRGGQSRSAADLVAAASSAPAAAAPAMLAGRATGVNITRASAAPNNVQASDMAFEQAKAASAQRDARSVATLDSLSDAAGKRDGETAATSRRVSGRQFNLEQGVWTDRRLLRSDKLATWTVKVQAYSPAWFAVMNAIPSLKEVLSLGDRVRVAGTSVVLEVATDGVTSLDAATVTRFTNAW